jgi:hypothetical protein
MRGGVVPYHVHGPKERRQLKSQLTHTAVGPCTLPFSLNRRKTSAAVSRALSRSLRPKSQQVALSSIQTVF